MKRSKGYWTIELCHKEALKYSSRSEFRSKSLAACAAAWKKGWLDEICSHMKPLGSLYERLIYAYEFPDKSVYVGLTHDSDERYEDHMINKKGQVYKHINKTKLTPKYKLLTDYIDVYEASKKEGMVVEEYRNNGWKILNKAKTGSVGSGVRKWTKEKCLEVSKKCKFKKEYYENYKASYLAARKNGWLDECCKHMIVFSKPNGYWDVKENCIKAAKESKNRSEFIEKFSGAYKQANKFGWIDECYSYIKTNYIYTSIKVIIKIIKNYKSISEWRKKHINSYKAAQKKGWLKKIYKEMNWG